jgi:hypothetical protein
MSVVVVVGVVVDVVLSQAWYLVSFIAFLILFKKSEFLGIKHFMYSVGLPVAEKWGPRC